MALQWFKKVRMSFQGWLLGMIFLLFLGVGIHVLSRAEENKNQKQSQLSIKEVNAHRLKGWVPLEASLFNGLEAEEIYEVSFPVNAHGEMLFSIRKKDNKYFIARYNGKSWSYIDAANATGTVTAKIKKTGEEKTITYPVQHMTIGPKGVVYAVGHLSDEKKPKPRLFSSVNGGPLEPIPPGGKKGYLYVTKNDRFYTAGGWGTGMPVYASSDGKTFEQTSPAEKIPGQTKPPAAYAFNMHPVTGDLYVSGEGDGVWSSSDDGKTWRRLDVPSFHGGNMFDLQFDTEGNVLIASSSHSAGIHSNGMWRYKDGKWTQILKGEFLGDGVYYICAACNTGVIYAGAWTGIFQSADNGQTWDTTSVETGIQRKEMELFKGVLKVNFLQLGPDGYLYTHVTGAESALYRSTTPVINQPPMITTAPWVEPKDVNLSKPTTVDVVASDLDPVPLIYTWSKVKGPGRITFTPKGDRPSAAAAVFSTPGMYTLGINVSDGQLSTSEELKVEVRPANGPGPEIAFHKTSESGSEANTKVNLEVFLHSPSNKEVSVDYEVVGGTATAGVDYELANGKLLFPPGKTSMTIPLVVKNDQTDEVDETVEVVLSGATGAHLGFDSMTTYTITDDDPPPIVSFETPFSSGDELTNVTHLKVILAKSSEQEITVDYAVSGGTATVGKDYELANGKLKFKPGEIAQTIPLTVLLDALKEEDETVIVTLSNPIQATLGANKEHTYTIKNVEAPKVAFSQAASEGSEEITPMNLTVTLSAASTRAITVDYAVKGGTTDENIDYTLKPGTLTFNPGETSKTISMDILDDKNDEPDKETIKIGLSNPTNAVLEGAALYTYTIIDNDPLPKVTFKATSSKVNPKIEGPQERVWILINIPTGKRATVQCKITGGTAEEWVDYNHYGNIGFSGLGEDKTSPEFHLLPGARKGQTVEFTLTDPKECELGAITKHLFTVD